MGCDIVAKSLRAPVRLIASNAGVEGDVIIEKLLGKPFEIGYNAVRMCRRYAPAMGRTPAQEEAPSRRGWLCPPASNVLPTVWPLTCNGAQVCRVLTCMLGCPPS